MCVPGSLYARPYMMYPETHISAEAGLSEKALRDLRQSIFNHMLETRGWKYRAFLRYLRLFKYAAFAPTRGKFLEAYYILMRYLDDIVDGDVPLPPGYDSAAEYMKEKIDFSKSPISPKDEVESLMVFCFELAKKFRADFTHETEDILSSLLFDAKRKDKLIVFPATVLNHHFHKLDIRGTVRATLKIFKEDPEKYEILEPLGMASRFQYDIEDIDTDLAAGYVNISEEDCREMGISEDDLRNPDAPSIRRWLKKHALEGMELLEEHHKRLPSGKFSLISRATFPLVYEWPARKVFLKTLNDKKAIDK